ncbi:O-methyltransferase, putative [Talaromyces marneffei ATCC 18224]|uniref:O-methyltransferase, putative n=1 Tax=Talaromyces marneffei (strain ATCC 18224 / CBS 334.59 / QM 7333) TaxID=441960 RepID=B6QEG9_TALMQ|nr:O-methyltransferase, putative [Talaromyces marneffei ATCC 18224]
MAHNRIVELATSISQNVAKIDSYLKSNGLSSPSFDIDSPFMNSFPEEIGSIRDAILEANLELSELLLGPKETFVEYQYNYFVCMRALYQYKIPFAFPVGEEATFGQIASNCNCSEAIVRRIMRLAMTNRIFKEVRKGVVVHTATSKALAEDEKFCDYVGMRCEEMCPAELNTIPAMLKWPDSEDPSQTGFSLANNTTDTMYQIMGKDPARAQRFSNAMAFRLTGPALKLDFLVEHGPWGALPTGGTVVDIGGSHGKAMVAIAEKFPSLRFIVQDLPSTIAARRPIPPEFDHCISFMEHDFFTPQPITGADVYLFRWIFHNWPDKHCIRILKNLVPALRQGSKVVVSEICLPEPNTIVVRKERKLRAMDVAMMTMQNAQERDKGEWVDLFKRADERFRFVEVVQPEESDLAVIEFTWQE